MNVAPGATYEAVIETGVSGLVGTIKYGLLDNQGGTTQALSTAGIIETPTGSGIYAVTREAPTAAGQYTGLWSLDGTTDPDQVATDELVVSFSAATVATGDGFATYADLEVRLGVTFDTAEQTRAEALLVLATGLIRDAVAQEVSLVEDDSLTRPGSSADRVRLPERPVVSVSSVTLNGGALVEGTDWYLDGDEIVRQAFSRPPAWWSPRFGHFGPGFLGPQYELVIVYTHGYATIPPLVRAICVEMAARVWNNPASVVRETYGSESIQYHDGYGTGLLLTDGERKALVESLRRTSGSVVLR